MGSVTAQTTPFSDWLMGKPLFAVDRLVTALAKFLDRLP